MFTSQRGYILTVTIPQIRKYFQSVEKFCVLYLEGHSGSEALERMKMQRKHHRRAFTITREMERRAGWIEAGMSPTLVPSRWHQ